MLWTTVFDLRMLELPGILEHKTITDDMLATRRSNPALTFTRQYV